MVASRERRSLTGFERGSVGSCRGKCGGAALRAIVQHKGAVVPELDTHKGRRVIKEMPVHPDCKEAMKAREIKWERLEAEATEVAASATDH